MGRLPLAGPGQPVVVGVAPLLALELGLPLEPARLAVRGGGGVTVGLPVDLLGAAEQLLGLSRLRRVSALVRPDIYGKRPAREPGAEDRASLTITPNRTSEHPSPWLMAGRDRGDAR